MEKQIQFSIDEYNEAISYAIEILQSVSPQSTIPANFQEQEKILRIHKREKLVQEAKSNLQSALVMLDVVYNILPYDDETDNSIRLSELRSELSKFANQL